ncbi:MAG TPA: ABC transporter substrate-binding protein [Chloroflexota bacterium]|nr:ABC transporter substrate-binding protein [Chloroflexota bacterium]
MKTERRGPRPRTAWVVLVGLLVAACGPAASVPATPAAAGSAAAAPATAAAVAGAGVPAAVAPVAAAPSTPPERVPLKVAVQGRPDQAHLQLALDRGYFTAQGLDVETVQITSGAEMVPALATNQIQVGNGAPSAALYNALARDVDIRLVADYAHVGPPTDTVLAILVRKDLWDSGTVRSLADLKDGRVFAAGTVPGTVSDLLYNKALAKEGISGDGIQMQYMPIPDVYAALANGRIDAGTLTEPLTTQAVQQGIATVLYPAGAVIPGAILSVLQYSPQFAAEQPDAATRFMVGYLQGVRDYYDAFVLQKDRDAAIDTLMQSLAPKDRRMWETAHYMSTDQNGAVDVNDLRSSAEFYLQHGDFGGPIPDFAKFIDTRFAEAAVQILGRR